MSTRRIPPQSWPSFFDSFTQQHHGWLVTIDTDSGRVAEEEPLDEVRARDDEIDIHAGTHYRVPHPTIVTVTTAEDDDAAIDRVEIESGSEKLTMRFRAAMNPALVDGLIP